jgi:hypothetical protein
MDNGLVMTKNIIPMMPALMSIMLDMKIGVPVNPKNSVKLFPSILFAKAAIEIGNTTVQMKKIIGFV